MSEALFFFYQHPVQHCCSVYVLLFCCFFCWNHGNSNPSVNTALGTNSSQTKFVFFSALNAGNELINTYSKKTMSLWYKNIWILDFHPGLCPSAQGLPSMNIFLNYHFKMIRSLYEMHQTLARLHNLDNGCATVKIPSSLSNLIENRDQLWRRADKDIASGRLLTGFELPATSKYLLMYNAWIPRLCVPSKLCANIPLVTVCLWL